LVHWWAVDGTVVKDKLLVWFTAMEFTLLSLKSAVTEVLHRLLISMVIGGQRMQGMGMNSLEQVSWSTGLACFSSEQHPGCPYNKIPKSIKISIHYLSVNIILKLHHN